MKKVRVEVVGLASTESNSAYALILKEVDGERRLPIIIGAFEAQAIALELENMRPPRPMTHDLLKSVIEALDSNLVEVCIHDLRDGTFYAYLLLEDGEVEVDARPSDAIALALRCGSPIYVAEDVMEEAALSPSSMEEGAAEEEAEEEEQDFFERLKRSSEEAKASSAQPKDQLQRLQQQLQKAIEEEDYERAARIRDEIRRLMQRSSQ
ncbi:MAG: bifunctional nuclease domain-containing protein [Chlorobiota bacterium]